jgi:predicted TPR repeat methyltransferase
MTAQSSGNLLADRRFAWALESRKAKDHVAAVDLLRQAVELAPEWAAGWLELGEELQTLGRTEEALEAFATAARFDADGTLGAALHRDALAGITPAAVPGAYVAALFDGYADRFDRHLIGSLEYRAPQLIVDALDRVRPNKRFSQAFDLGCGTGLAGEAIRDRVAHLVGVDLSAEMVAHPRIARRYDEVEVGDLVNWLGERPAASADLALAADVLVYFGALDPVFRAVARVLMPSGLFVFTVQALQEGSYRFGQELRYSHAETYLREQAAEAGLAVALMEPAVTRRNQGRDVPGLLAVLECSA